MEHFETEKIFHLEDIKFHPNINLIIGDEGVGKTSLLNYIGYKTEGFLILRIRNPCKIMPLGTLDFDYKWLADENCPLGRRHVLFDALKFFFRGRLTEEEIKRICFIDNEQPKLSATLKLSLLSKSFYKIFYIIASIQNHIYAHDGRDKFTVLIDDLDAFLHPKWQQTIIEDLTSYYKNIRFIITTNSPLMVGAVDKSSVFLLRLVDDERVLTGVREQTLAVGANYLLALLFDVNSSYVCEASELLSEYHALCAQLLHETQEGKEIKEKLIAIYSGNHYLIRDLERAERLAVFKAKLTPKVKEL